jgi:hypothetical protein
MVFGSATLFAQDAIDGHGSPEPPAAGVHWAKGENNGQGNGNAFGLGGFGGVKLLKYYGGPVQSSGSTVHPIFWGKKWTDPTFVGDKIKGIEAFYSGVGGTAYAGTTTEYYDSGGHVSPAVILGGPSVIDNSTAPTSGQSTSTILAEACSSSPKDGDYYPVYVDSPRGNSGYCAWHSAGTCGVNGPKIQFAFFYNLDGDAGCDPGGSRGSFLDNSTKPATTNQNSQGLAALANVSGHELSEMMTDPKLNAWMDRSGSENADKCAWTFGKSLINFTNSSQWKIQGNWSNAAYNSITGYVRGCIDGN